MEEWKDIVIEQDGIVYDYTEKYKVSNTGKVFSVKYGRCLKAADYKGYKRVKLYGNDGSSQMFLVHRLVALMFIPNPSGYPVVNHKDENKSNNTYENLEWCTTKYNNNYGTVKQRIGDSCRGDKSSCARKVKCIETGQIFTCIKYAVQWVKENTDTSTCGTNISKCCKGKREKAGGFHWTYVTEEEYEQWVKSRKEI